MDCSGRAAPTRNAQSDVALTCYEFGGVGHFGRECPTRMKRQHLRKSHENRRANSFLLSVQKEAVEYHTARLNLRRGKPNVRVNIRGVSREFIVDSGSRVSLIQPGIYRSEVRPSSTTSFGATGDELDILGNRMFSFLSTIGTTATRFVLVPSQQRATEFYGWIFCWKLMPL